MPLIIEKVRGRPVGLYMALLGVGVTTPPASQAITVATGGAAAGANTVPVDALPVAVPKNTVLTFTRAAGSPADITVVVTEDADAAATSLSVEMFEGEEGAGLEYDLAAADAASWDQLHTVAGTEDSPYSNNAQTQNQNPVTYGGSTGVSVADVEIQSVAPQIARSGLFLAEGPLTEDLLRYADTNRSWWVAQVNPKADGTPYNTRAGRAKVHGLSEPKPAGDLLRMSFNIQFVGSKPSLTFH